MAGKRSFNPVKSPYLWTIVLRLVFAWIWPRHLQGDAADFENIVTNILNGNGFSRCLNPPYPPTAQRPPLYPYVLAAVYWMGISKAWGAIALNLACDLVSMKVATLWARDLKFTRASWVPWLIGFCPLLLTYGVYPTTESISVMLFIVATFFAFRDRVLISGIFWGLLALCRSYYLLFPFVLCLLPPRRRWSMKECSLLIVGASLAPLVWTVRNYFAMGHFAFSQGGMVGWQIYQGVMFPGFDWWKPEHVQELQKSQPIMRLFASHCMTDAEIYGIDRQALAQVMDHSRAHPFEIARNLLVKQLNLLTNWGLILPYDTVPYMVTQAINAVLYLYWGLALRIFYFRIRTLKALFGRGSIPEGVRYSLVNVIYVSGVTLPFAVDSRYVLAPFIILLIVFTEVWRWKRAGTLAP